MIINNFFISRTPSPKRLAADHAYRYARLLNERGGTNIITSARIEPVQAVAEVVLSMDPAAFFYPMRSGDNMGTGSTLNGVNTTRRPVLSSSTWGANGIVCGASQFVTGLEALTHQSQTWFGVVNNSGASPTRSMWTVVGVPSGATFGLHTSSASASVLIHDNNADTSVNTNIAGIQNAGWRFFAIAWDKAANQVRINFQGSPFTQNRTFGTAFTSAQTIQVNRGGGQQWEGTTALWGYLPRALTAAQMEAIRTALRTHLTNDLLP